MLPGAGASVHDNRTPSSSGSVPEYWGKAGGCPYTCGMNYRHAFHAGNFADVLKHVVLFALVEALQIKPTPLCYIDTHAGRGIYPLDSAEAIKTAEFHDGVARLDATGELPPLLARWKTSLLAVPGNQNGLRCYPGSPLQVAQLLRPGDSAQLCELQPEEASALHDLFRADRRVHVQQRDGYAALKALLPPAQKRGLVLIDPPYEAQQAEYPLIKAALGTALKRWPTGIHVVWYPIKRRSDVQPFLRWAGRFEAKRTLCVELLPHPAESPLRLNGSGMVIFNAPWKLDETLHEPLLALSHLLGQGHPVQRRLDWLRTEAGVAVAP